MREIKSNIWIFFSKEKIHHWKFEFDTWPMALPDNWIGSWNFKIRWIKKYYVKSDLTLITLDDAKKWARACQVSSPKKYSTLEVQTSPKKIINQEQSNFDTQIKSATKKYDKLNLTLITLDDAQCQKVRESQLSSSYFLQKTITVLMESRVKTGRKQIGKYLSVIP